MEVIVSAVLTVVGIAMLCFGGNWLVSGGAAIARRFRISNLVIGMTIVAYGTSTPELAASIAAAGEHSAIILGNVIGSNIANIGMVIGTASILIPLAIGRTMLRREIPIMIAVSLLLVIVSIDGKLDMYDGIILLAGLAVFGYYTCRNAMQQRDTSTSDNTNGDSIARDSNRTVTKHERYTKQIGLVGLGVGFLYVGAIFTVDNAVILAETFGLSEKLIGLTIIAIGTSLPELITSIIAIRKGHTDIGVGNIIGSNIYNILMIMGVGTLLGGVVLSSEVYLDYTIMILFSATLFVAIKTRSIGRIMGVCLVAGYMAYLTLVFFR